MREPMSSWMSRAMRARLLEQPAFLLLQRQLRHQTEAEENGESAHGQ